MISSRITGLFHVYNTIQRYRTLRRIGYTLILTLLLFSSPGYAGDTPVRLGFQFLLGGGNAFGSAYNQPELGDESIEKNGMLNIGGTFLIELPRKHASTAQIGLGVRRYGVQGEESYYLYSDYSFHNTYKKTFIALSIPLLSKVYLGPVYFGAGVWLDIKMIGKEYITGTQSMVPIVPIDRTLDKTDWAQYRRFNILPVAQFGGDIPLLKNNRLLLNPGIILCIHTIDDFSDIHASSRFWSITGELSIKVVID